MGLWTFSSLSFASSSHVISFSQSTPSGTNIYGGLGSSIANGAGLSAFTGGVSITQSITTSYTTSSSTATSTNGTQTAVSPAGQVAINNAQNATDFLNCTAPVTPAKTNGTFISQGSKFIGGAACLNNISSLNTKIELDTEIHDTFHGLNDPLDLATFTVDPLKLSNISDLQLHDFAYSPEVDGELSNGYATNSYIFQSVPSFAQNAIWSWTAPFADFSHASSGSSDYKMDDEIWTDGQTTLLYSYEVKTTLNWVHNINLPFSFAPNGLFNPASNSMPLNMTHIVTPVFPYLFFNFNLTMNSGASFTTPNLTTLSYGIFTPATYYSPNTLDTFPLNVPGLFISNLENASSGSTYNTTTFPSNDIGIGINQPAPANIFSPNYHLVSIAAMPNDYVFILVNSTDSAPQGSGHYYFGVARAVAPGYYQRNFANTSALRKQLPGVVGCKTESDCQKTWNSTWSAYWAKELVQDGSSLFLLAPGGSTGGSSSISSILNNIIQGSPTSTNASVLVPLYNMSAGNLVAVSGVPQNISVDYLGDVFIVGQQSSGGDSYIAKFQNLNFGSKTSTSGYNTSNSIRDFICASASCFKPSYYDVSTQTPESSDFSSSGQNSSSRTAPSTAKSDKFQSIAVSPDGRQVYVATPVDGNVTVLDGENLSYESSINLAYAYTPPGASQLASSAFPTLNIGYWLANNGLYNQSLPFASSFASSAGNASTLDKSGFHHPLGLADVNGYLYVLDDWTGFVSGSSGSSIDFNMIMLRAMNSTGSNIPIQPTFFNDMSSQSTCSVNPSSALAKNPDQCWTSPPAGGNSNCMASKSGAGSVCSLASVSGGCAFSSGSKYQCVNSASESSSYYTLSSGNFYPSNAYPPYGWVISANVTSGGGSGGGSGATFCISSSCTYNPVNLAASTIPNSTESSNTSVSKYFGSYYPLGPPIHMKTCGTVSVLFGSSCYGLPTGIGFSVNFNNTASILFPVTGPNSGNQGSILGFGELLFADFNLENYTKLFTGVTPYVCYRSNSTDTSGNGSNQTNSSFNDGCYDSANMSNILAPIYNLNDPFTYFENLGSQQVLSFANQFSSTFAGGNSSSGSSSSGVSQACQNEISNASLPVDCQGYQASTINLTNLGSLQNLTGTPSYPSNVPVLRSTVSGAALVPYAYSVSTTETFSNWQLECSSGDVYSQAICAATEAVIEAKAAVQSTKDTGTKIYYDLQPSNLTSSNTNNAPVEGGASYLAYVNGNNNGYYRANLSDAGVFLNPQIFFNLSTDRLFGGLYINVTQSLDTNTQLVLNATQQLNYITNFYTVGSSLKYETVNSVVLNPAVYGASNASGLSSPQTSNATTGLSYVTENSISTGFGKVNLFDWYKQVVYNNPLKLFINGSAANNFPYGYRRLVYVLQDRFDNNIYVPLDADIANQTTMTMNITPEVSPLNSAQTNVTIRGRIGYYTFNASSTVFIPLSNSSVYLYYNNNLNYNGLSTNGTFGGQSTNVQVAQLCAYGTPGAAGVPRTCTPADPLTPGQSAEANVVNYAPDYNGSSGTCSPAPMSLLYQQNFTCNIYGGDNLPATCPTGGSGKQEYCYVQDSQGDGLCTSQIGLIGVATTNSLGEFSSNITACGIGTARILAQYYGSPGPEPVQAHQAPLFLAANPTIPIVNGVAGSITSPIFNVYNYTWTPNQTGATLSIGLYELGYGNASATEVLGAVGLVAAIAALKLSFTPKQRNSHRKARKSSNKTKKNQRG